MTTENNTLDVSKLPTFAFGTRNPMWWGTQFFMVIEGLGFVFGIAVYLYLYNQNQSWPLGTSPEPLLWPSLLILVMLLSEIPNVWLKKAAARHDLAKVRKGLLVMSAVGVLCCVIRAFEIHAVHVRWDDNAYGSIFWFLLGLHATHLITDVGETLVMTVMIFIGPVDMRRFSEVEDNQDYWHFVVFFWALIYIVLYWLTRWLEVKP